MAKKTKLNQTKQKLLAFMKNKRHMAIITIPEEYDKSVKQFLRNHGYVLSNAQAGEYTKTIRVLHKFIST